MFWDGWKIWKKKEHIYKNLSKYVILFWEKSLPQHHFLIKFVTSNNKLFERHFFLQHVLKHLMN